MREHRVGQLGIGHQGCHLEEYAECQVPEVNVGQCAHLAPMSGHEREDDVEHEQEREHGADADAHLAPGKWAPVPPAGTVGLGCLLGRHQGHVGTAHCSQPVMLMR